MLNITSCLYENGALTRRKGAALLAAAISALSVGNVMAASGLEEVVVTARKVEENVQTVPIAISSITAEGLQQQGATNITGIAMHVPNMTFSPPIGNGTAVRVAIRGQVQNDIVGTLDQSIGFYVDDMIWARPVGAKMNLSDVQRVEVLRGPQGTLFGRNTTGGAIQLYTNNPEFDLDGRVGVRLGNYDRRDYNLMFNAPVIDDKLAVRVAYDAMKRDGWQENVIGDYSIAEDDVQNLIGKVLLEATDDLEFLLKLDRVEGNYLGTGSKMTNARPAPTFGGLDPVFVASGGSDTSANYVNTDFKHITENIKPLTEFSNKGVALTTSWDVSNEFNVKLITGYREVEYSSTFDLDGTPYSLLSTTTSLSGYHEASVELQLSGAAFDDTVSWTAGVYGFKEAGTDRSQSVLPAAFGIAQNVFGDTENSSKALFGQLTWQTTDELAITAGLRYSEESKELESKNFIALASAPGTFAYCEVPPVFTGNPNFLDQSGCRANFERDDESIDYTLNINYALTSEVMIYGKVASGFRSGGQNLRGGTADPSTLNDAGVISTFASFQPESVTEYELGFKGDLFDRHLRLNLAAFYSAYDDIQRSTIVPTGGGGTATVVRNAASGTVKGLEAEITLVATDAWQLGLTGGWTDAAYDEFEDINPATQAPLDRSQEAFPGTPEYSYSAWTSYVIPVATGELTLRADYSWRDEMLPTPTSDAEGITVPAVGLLNARVTWDPNPQLSLALWGANLTDESYRADGIEFYSGFGYALGSPGEPRMFGIEASYKFGN